MPCENCCGRILYGIGISLILIGVAIVFVWPLVFDNVQKNNLVLSPDSESYKLWIKTPMPLYTYLYLYNWTNSEEFIRDKRVKPSFEEVGPFVFKEVHERVNLGWNGDSVSYNQTRTWHFLPDESVDLSVPITNLNVVVTTITRIASNYNFFVQEFLKFINYFYKEKLIVTRPAGQWLFDGMSDSLLDFVRKIKPGLVPYHKFGWFYNRNLSSTYDGRFNIKTGMDNIFDLGSLNEWNNQHKTNFFNGECAIVKGTTGEIFAPSKIAPDNLTIFLSDFCGPFTLKNSGTTTVHSLEGYHYVGDESVFDNGTKYPGAECFCTGACSPSGVRNVTLCREAPLFISFPHFYLADPIYTQSIDGMKPNKSEHEFYITINPLTGLPLEVRAQLQINILLEPLPAIDMFSNVPKVYLPMIWFRQRVEVPDELVFMGTSLEFFRKLGLGLGCGLAVVGSVLIAIRLIHECSGSREEKRLLPGESKKESEHESSSDEENR